MRYYIKCKLNPDGRKRLVDSIKSGNLAKGKIFYEGMQAALREAAIDEKDVVHFVEVCYCLEGGLYPMSMEMPTLEEYFDSIIEVKDARLRGECTMECEACDCTRAIKLPGKSLVDKLGIQKEGLPCVSNNNNSFVDMGRIRLNRRKRREGIEALRNVINECKPENIKPVMAGAAISGLFVIFQDNEFFRVKNIPDTREARQLISEMGLVLNDTVEMVKTQARSSLARSDRRSNIV
jgi:hypothetical protein